MNLLAIARAARTAQLRRIESAVHEAWLLHFADSEPRLIYFAPPVTHSEALDWYPAAVAAKALHWYTRPDLARPLN